MQKRVANLFCRPVLVRTGQVSWPRLALTQGPAIIARNTSDAKRSARGTTQAKGQGINTRYQPALNALYGRQVVIREIYGATER